MTQIALAIIALVTALVGSAGFWQLLQSREQRPAGTIQDAFGSLTQQVAELKQQLDDERTKWHGAVAELAVQLDRSNDQAAALRRDLDATRERLDRAQEQLTIAQEQLTIAQDELTVTRALLTKSHRETERLRVQLEETRKELTDDIDSRRTYKDR